MPKCFCDYVISKVLYPIASVFFISRYLASVSVKSIFDADGLNFTPPFSFKKVGVNVGMLNFDSKLCYALGLTVECLSLWLLDTIVLCPVFIPSLCICVKYTEVRSYLSSSYSALFSSMFTFWWFEATLCWRERAVIVSREFEVPTAISLVCGLL